ncbi:hypothetical protein [Cohnella sp. GCM10027633]|uniref:hypothetical protein n=1 Tax=unclassified Cohnella TaxID=2636738 RepID=UPI00363B8A0C
MPAHDQDTLSRRWVWTAAIGLALFLLIQVLPTSLQVFKTEDHDVLTRAQAENKALSAAADRFGVARSDVSETTVTHLSDSDAVGYYSKNDLGKAYDDRLDATMPTDYYRVDLHLAGDGGTLRLLLHLETGSLVGWRHAAVAGASAGGAAPALESGGGAEQAARALHYAEAWGVHGDDWEWTGRTQPDGSSLFVSKKPLGEAEPWLSVRAPAGFEATASSLPPWKGGFVVYGTQLPAEFLSYMDKQEHLASEWSKYGYILPELFMLVCAIVAAGTYVGHSSYRRGIFLAGLFFVLYVAYSYNMIPGMRASVMGVSTDKSDAFDPTLLTVSIIIYGAMALLTYLAAVGGDGLWKSMGYSLWPRWKEAGYGNAVLKSMKTGYFLAFILLGAQSVVLIVLEQSLGSFASSDPSQSMYNMTYPLLLPVLAWCAGISEELQSRLFGIGLFRKWFVGGARKLLRREPSARAASWLTFAAMVPPGLLWAFGHVGYAVYPVYTRVIELVLLSLLFGWFMLRFGLMAVIFAHVTLDAVLMGVQMMTDGLPGDYWGGLFSLVMPGLAGLAIWRLHRMLRRPGSA